MADVQEFKCPRCGGKLEFDAAGQTMKCPYCDSTFDPESLRRASDNATAGPADAPAAGEEAAWEPAGQNWTGAEESAVQTYGLPLLRQPGGACGPGERHAQAGLRDSVQAQPAAGDG